jgi:neutral ceramidase
MFESTKIIAQKQYKKAKELFNSAQTKVKGDIEYIYQNINMSHYEVKLSQNKTVFTCKPALGFSFAAGTTDGEGASMV